MLSTSFRVNLHSIVCLNVKALLSQSRRHIWSLTDSNRIRTHDHLVRKRTINHLAKVVELCHEYLSVRCIWLYVIIMSRTSFRVKLHSIVCLNIKELFARSRRHIWSKSDSNEIRTHNHLVRKRTLDHLAQLEKWLSCVVYSQLNHLASLLKWLLSHNTNR